MEGSSLYHDEDTWNLMAALSPKNQEDRFKPKFYQMSNGAHQRK